MKHVLMLSFLILAGNLAFGQKFVDPTYSVNNYKHPNKAAYARKHNLDKSTELTSVTVADNGDYKHPGKTVMTRKASFLTKAEDKSRTSYKHQHGL